MEVTLASEVSFASDGAVDPLATAGTVFWTESSGLATRGLLLLLVASFEEVIVSS